MLPRAPRSRVWLGGVVLLASLLGAACEDDSEPAVDESAAAGSPGPATPRAAQPAQPTAPAAKTSPSADDGPRAPDLGCVQLSTARLGAGLGPARLLARTDGLWVVSYARRDGQRRLARLHVPPGADQARALPELPLGAARAEVARVPPSVAGTDGLWVAAVDGEGQLRVFAEAERDAPKGRPVDKRVDRRFAPALSALDRERALVAWTEGDATGMRVRAARVEPDVIERLEVMPLGHGASAPRFILGGRPHRLLMLDARAGVSPLLAVPFSSAGVPSEAKVWRPIGQPYAPPSLIGVQLEGQPVQVAYTALGNAATAAVGIVDADDLDAPQALLSGTGYALLAVDAALGPRRAVFAMDAPQDSQPAPELQVHVRVWDGERPGTPFVVRPDAGSASRPALAYDRSRAQFALAYTHDGALWLSWLRCDA